MSMEPVNLSTPDAKYMLDCTLNQLLPIFTGAESLTSIILMYNMQDLYNALTNATTEYLFMLYKALGYYSAMGEDPNVVGPLYQYVNEILKSRY